MSEEVTPAIETSEPANTTIAIAPKRGTITKEQVELIKRTICRGATDDELELFVGQCNRTGLDPFARQIHAVQRWSSDLGRNVMTIQTGIDGYRLIAERTGLYAGNEDPVYDHDDNTPPNKATVTVWKIVNGQRVAFTRSARWNEFVQRNREGVVTKFWRTMPYLMLGKVAEALALRAAFPQELSGIYTSEEMDQASNDGPEQLAGPQLAGQLEKLAKTTCERAHKDFAEWCARAKKHYGCAPETSFAAMPTSIIRELIVGVNKWIGTLAKNPPAKPAPTSPAQQSTQAAKSAPAQPAAAPPVKPGTEFYNRIRKHEAELVERFGITPAALQSEIMGKAMAAGFGISIDDWTAAQVNTASLWANDYASELESRYVREPIESAT